jgi:putative ABC transport system permease protein
MLVRDLQIPLRRLRRAPGFSALAALTLALAIAADTSVWSLAEAVLLRPLPYRDPGRLVCLWEDHARGGGDSRLTVAQATFDDYRRRSHAFAGMAALASHSFNMMGAGGPESVFGSEVSADFFQVLGVQARLGRVIIAEPGPGEPALVLSHALWLREFGGDRRILGRGVQLDDRSYTVIGVMPPEFSVPLHLKSPRQAAELWTVLRPRPALDNHAAHGLQVIGRLAPGVTLAQARGDVDGIARRIAAEFPKDCAGVGATLVPLTEQIVGAVRGSLLTLLGAATFLLLIACTNVACLLLARALDRERESAVCAALGARWTQLAAQPMGESLLLVASGGAAGTLLAMAAVRLLPAVLPPDLPRAEGIRLDAGALGYTLLVTLLAGLGCGLIPAWRAARSGVRSAGAQAAGLRGSGGASASAGRRQNRALGALMSAQMALALLLAVASGLTIESFLRLSRVDPGFRAANVLTFALDLPPQNYPTGRRTAFFRELIARLSALPGVISAAGISRLPLDPSWGVGALSIAGKPDPPGGPPLIGEHIVTPGYFQTLGIPLLEGRQLGDHDDLRSPLVALVNRSLVRRFWPHERSVGRRIVIDGDAIEVVGVVGDVAHDSLAAEPRPEAYVPEAQEPVSGLQIVVRAGSDPLPLAAAVRRTVAALDPEQPIERLRTMARQIDDALARPRGLLAVVGSFAALALALAAVGVFSLAGYSVAARRREIGIRMAIGARPRDAQLLILGQIGRLALAGVLAGAAGSWFVTRWLASQLFQVGGAEVAPLLSGAALLAGVALIAAQLQARHAARIDPMIALRHD